MRVSAIAAGPDFVGEITANGNRIGDITAAGTLTLIVFVGGLGGLIAGVVVVGSERWLSRAGLARGFGYGVVLLALVGGGDPFDSADFLVLEPVVLNVTMFIGLFVILGISIDLLFRVLDRVAPAPAGAHEVSYLAIACAGAFPVLIIVALFTVPEFCGCTPDYLRLGAIMTMLLATVAQDLATTIWNPPDWMARTIKITGYGSLLILLAVGLKQAVTQIGLIIGN